MRISLTLRFPRFAQPVVLCCVVLLAVSGCERQHLPTGADGLLNPQITLRGDRVVKYHSPIKEVGRVLIQGRREDNGHCSFLYVVRLAPGDTLLERIAEYDPDTCRYVFARHKPSDAEKVKPGITKPRSKVQYRSAANSSASDYQEAYSERYGEYGATRVPTLGPGIRASGSASAFAAALCSMSFGDVKLARQHLWHWDPISIEVTSSEHTVTWAYNYECVQSSRSEAWQRWFAFSGWYRVGWYHDEPFPIDPDIQGVYNRTAVSYRNDAFCPGNNNPTFVQYWPNEIRVFSDGYRTFQWYSQDSGGCSSLLSGWRYAV